MRRASAIALLVLIATLPPGCARKAVIEQNPAVLSVPVKVAPAARGTVSRTLLVTGSLRTDDEVLVSSKVLGRVAQVPVKEGDRVSAGQPLVRLETTDFESQLAQARAGLQTAKIRYEQAKRSEQLRFTQTRTGIEQAKQGVAVATARLAQAQAGHKQAQADLARTRKLFDMGAVAARELDAARTAEETARAGVTVAQQILAQAEQALEAAQATTVQYQLTREDIRAADEGVKQAQAQVALAAEQLRSARIVSPISGVVYQRQVDVGETVTPAMPLMSLAGLQGVYFEADVPETEVASLDPGGSMEVTVDALPGRTFQGRIAKVIPVASTSTRSFRVRVSVAPGSSTLAPGSFVRGNLLVGRRAQALLVPKEAVQTALGENYVFVVVAGKAKRTPAKLGWSDARNAEVVSGVKDGDQVVVVGANTLRDGDPVKVLR